MTVAQPQPNTENAGQRRSVVPALNLFGLPSDSLVVEVASKTTPLLTWPRSHRATLSNKGDLHVTENGRIVRSFRRGAWRRAGRLINIRPEYRSVVVIEIEAAA
jgi:hypothetical protein